MFSKSFTTVVLAASVAILPASRVAADAGDFVAGALIGGLVGHVATKEAQKNRAARSSNTVTRTYRPAIPSTVEGREIQTSLNYFGFNAGSVDGQLGRRSRTAISQYQVYMGYPATGQLTAFEQSLLVGTYNRALAGGYAFTQQAATHPDGTRGLLKLYRAELAGPLTTQQAALPATTTTVVAPVTEFATAETDDLPQLPSFMGASSGRSLASHCNTISLLTNTNGGFTTVETMSDPNFALNEQFCLARTYAIAQGEDLASRVQGYTPQQIEQQCESLAPAMKGFVSALSLQPQQVVVQDVASFILGTGMSPEQLKGTAQICLGVGYRKDDMDVALGSALMLYALGEGVYGELMGHHLSQGFGTARRSDLALVWYEKGLEAGMNGAPAVFAPGQPERNDLIRKASMQIGGGNQATNTMSTPLQPVSTMPSFAIKE